MLVSKLFYEIIFVLLILYVYETYAGIHDKSCGSIHLSISARSRKILMNWYYNCDRLPNYLQLREQKNNQHQILKEVEVKISYGSYETDTVWRDDFPTNWHDSESKNRQYFICTQYHIVSIVRNVEEDSECLRIHPKWMSQYYLTFPRLRLRKLFIPGTHSSAAFGRLQHYDFYEQLVFGIRYMDMKVGINRNEASETRFYVNDKSFSLPKELRNIQKFMEKAKNEIVILDFRGFFSFDGLKDHELLIKYLRYFFHYQMAPVSVSVMHKDGPPLRYLQFFNYRIIVNYRYAEMTNKYSFLWNTIFMKDCNAKNPQAYKNCLRDRAENHNHTELLCTIVANLKTTNSHLLGHNVNVNLSRWLASKGLHRHVNILAVDYFETSNIIADAVAANMKKRPNFP